ncbi:MAG: ABC transporter, partial [Chloroflexi bacterium]|nr:ABC transporter [Chloroflexota bacterium]
MSKKLALALALIMALVVLAACGGGQATEAQAATEAP